MPHNIIQNCDNDGIQEDYAHVLEESENVLKQCLKEYKLEEIFLSFNGGKDCTVLLDITINLLKKMLPADDIKENILKVIYIQTENSFKELDEFVKQIENHYGLNLVTTQGDLRTALQRILDDDGRLKACLMGTRISDPYCANLKFIQKTDANWPQILRVSPLLNWSYHQIWTYILKNKVPYCSLYDQGYTSIGSKINTEPNPALAIKSCTGNVTYLPAWHLRDGTQERAGRGLNTQVKNQKLCPNGHESINGHINGSSIPNTL